MSQMTEIILSQWVIALALGALCVGLFLFGLVPALLIAARVRGVKGAVNAMRSDLHETFERLAEKQIEASKQHQAQLGEHLSASLREPLEKIVKSLQDYGKDQNAAVAQGLQDQMTTFAGRLDDMLGGQVSQAKELQSQTLKSLETTIAAFQDMARTMAKTAEGATVSMVKELRAGMSRTQVETDANLSELLGKLSGQVTSSVAALEEQSTQTTKIALEQQKKITEQAQQAIETLSNEVRSQTKAIESASQSMRTTGSDVANAVDRIIEGMTGLISGAAQEIMRSGQGFADIFEKSVALNRDLNETATALAESSKDIGVVVADYRNARETLQGMVDLIRTTAEKARDTSLTSDVVARIEIAAEKLIAAQGQADDYLVKLNGVLSGAHGAFSTQMLETVRDFQEHLSNTPPPGPMSEESQRRHSEFDRMISDWVQTTPRSKQGNGAPARDQRVPVAATGGRRK
jgi:archaellum component FlaC